MRRDVDEAEDRQRREVYEDDRAEKRTHLCRAARLHRKQSNEDRHGEGDDQRLEAGVDDGEPFDSRQDRDGRSDHRVAVEKRGREDSEQDEARRPALSLKTSRDQ